MSDARIDAIAAALSGAPESLVERSAAARAAAQGVSVDEVLAAWSGGAAIEAAPAPEAGDPAPAEAAPEAAAPEPVAEAPPVAVAVIEAAPPVEEEPEEVIEPASLGDRVRLGSRIGALLGGLLGIVAIVVMTPALLSRLGLPSGESTPAIEVTPLAAILAIAALSAAFGAIITVAVRGLAAFVSPAYASDSSSRASTMLGLVTGAVLGFAGGGTMIGMAETTLTGTKLLPVRSLTFTVLIGGVVLGAITGLIAQGVGQPATLHGEASEDSEVVRGRLWESLVIPVTSSVIILVIVVSLGTLFVEYHSYAPILAILVSIGILAFASLMASRPNLRISRGEVLVAAAGVGVVLLMLALVAAHTSSGGHDDEEHHGSSHSIVL